jgi:hypothetical protein
MLTPSSKLITSFEKDLIKKLLQSVDDCSINNFRNLERMFTINVTNYRKQRNMAIENQRNNNNKSKSKTNAVNFTTKLGDDSDAIKVKKEKIDPPFSEDDKLSNENRKRKTSSSNNVDADVPLPDSILELVDDEKIKKIKIEKNDDDEDPSFYSMVASKSRQMITVTRDGRLPSFDDDNPRIIKEPRERKVNPRWNIQPGKRNRNKKEKEKMKEKEKEKENDNKPVIIFPGNFPIRDENVYYQQQTLAADDELSLPPLEMPLVSQQPLFMPPLENSFENNFHNLDTFENNCEFDPFASFDPTSSIDYFPPTDSN